MSARLFLLLERKTVYKEEAVVGKILQGERELPTDCWKKEGLPPKTTLPQHRECQRF